jgi:hypothetical protein
MTAGLLRRVGLIVLAFAFLGGSLPHGAVFIDAAASAGTVVQHMYATHPDNDVRADDTPGTTTTNCQHDNDCLGCIAIDLRAGHRPGVALSWTLVTFRPGTAPLTGLQPAPELFPPIRQS